MGARRSPGEPELAKLLAACDGPAGDKRLEAALRLSCVEEPRAVARARAIVLDDRDDDRYDVAEELRSNRHPDARAFVLEIAVHPDLELRRIACWGLTSWRDEQATRALMALAHEADREIVEDALRELRRRTDGPELGMEVLELLSKVGDPGPRRQALIELKKRRMSRHSGGQAT